MPVFTPYRQRHHARDGRNTSAGDTDDSHVRDASDDGDDSVIDEPSYDSDDPDQPDWQWDELLDQMLAHDPRDDIFAVKSGIVADAQEALADAEHALAAAEDLPDLVDDDEEDDGFYAGDVDMGFAPNSPRPLRRSQRIAAVLSLSPGPRLRSQLMAASQRPTPRIRRHVARVPSSPTPRERRREQDAKHERAMAAMFARTKLVVAKRELQAARAERSVTRALRAVDHSQHLYYQKLGTLFTAKRDAGRSEVVAHCAVIRKARDAAISVHLDNQEAESSGLEDEWHSAFDASSVVDKYDDAMQIDDPDF